MGYIIAAVMLTASIADFEVTAQSNRQFGSDSEFCHRAPQPHASHIGIQCE
jgi:hypothetical protein